MNFLYFDTKQLFENSPDIFFCLPSTSSIQGKECLNVRTQGGLGSIQKEGRGEVSTLEREGFGKFETLLLYLTAPFQRLIIKVCNL